MSTRTLIRGGLVVTASDELHADVLIEDGRGGAPATPRSAGRVGQTAQHPTHPSRTSAPPRG
ncbi:dihydropyrimidinase, partial [Streptomyces sp. NPDC059525]